MDAARAARQARARARALEQMLELMLMPMRAAAEVGVREQIQARAQRPQARAEQVLQQESLRGPSRRGLR
jgi:hypothetical protein